MELGLFDNCYFWLFFPGRVSSNPTNRKVENLERSFQLFLKPNFPPYERKENAFSLVTPDELLNMQRN